MNALQYFETSITAHLRTLSHSRNTESSTSDLECHVLTPSLFQCCRSPNRSVEHRGFSTVCTCLSPHTRLLLLAPSSFVTYRGIRGEAICFIGYLTTLYQAQPIPVAKRSNARVYGRSLAGIVGSNSAGGHGCLSVVR